jgi:hypothetical protein
MGRTIFVFLSCLFLLSSTTAVGLTLDSAAAGISQTQIRATYLGLLLLATLMKLGATHFRNGFYMFGAVVFYALAGFGIGSSVRCFYNELFHLPNLVYFSMGLVMAVISLICALLAKALDSSRNHIFGI